MYRFYCPNYSSRIVKIGNAKFIENGEVSGSADKQAVDVNEIKVDASFHIIVPTSTAVPYIVPEQNMDNEAPHEETNLPLTDVNELRGIALNKPVRARRLAIPDDYVVYLQESDFDCGIDEDPVSFSQAINNDMSNKWIDAMKEELNSMAINKVWDLVELPECLKRVGVNGFLGPNATRMAISNDIKLGLLPMVMLRKMALIIKRLFHLFLKKIL